MVRVTSKNFKIGPLGDFEKMRFWPILGLFLILGHFRAVFGPFFGGVQIFWSLNIIGGDHRPILFFIVFHFWAILGHFCQFWAVFHFGAFLHFRVVRGAKGGGAIDPKIFGNFTNFTTNLTLTTFKFGSF